MQNYGIFIKNLIPIKLIATLKNFDKICLFKEDFFITEFYCVLDFVTTTYKNVSFNKKFILKKLLFFFFYI